MRRTILTLCLAASAAACGTDAATETPPRAATEDDDAPALPRLVPGDEHRYAVVWTVQTEANDGMLGDVPLHGGLAIEGELRMRVYERMPDGIVLGLALTQLHAARVEVFGQDVLPGPQALLDYETLIVVPDDGDVRRVLFDPAAPSVYRHVMTGLLAHVDLRRPDPSAKDWTRVAMTGDGLAEVHYARDDADPRTLTKRVGHYLRVDAAPDASPDTPWRTGGQTSIELDETGLPRRIVGEQLTAIADPESPMQLSSSTHFELTRTDAEHGAVQPVPDVGTYTELDLHARPDDEESQRELARKFAEGLTTSDLIMVVQSAGNGLRPAAGFQVRARGLLRGWPETAGELTPLFADAPDSRTRQFILDLLVSADTPQAQAELVAILDAASEDPELPVYLQHLTLLRTPTPELGGYLAQTHEAAADDPRLRRSTLYPMGTMANALAATDPMLAERMLSTLRGELDAATDPADRVAALAGLGNASRAEDMPRVRAHAADPDSSVRAQVASSLRHHPDSETDDVLFAMLTDDDRLVAAASLSVIDFYRADDASLQRLAKAVIAGEHHPEIIGVLASVFAKRGLEDPTCQAALEALMGRTEDNRERVRLSRLLGRHRS